MPSCTDPGSTNPDISGLGIIIAFATQAGISVILSIAVLIINSEPHTDLGQLRLLFRKVCNVYPGRKSTREYSNKDLKLEVIQDILSTTSDGQTLNGIALLVAGLVQNSALDLYHYHIVYDCASFTGVSFCAALSIVFQSRKERRYSRYFAIGIFTILFLAFILFFGNALNSWNWSHSGGCYNTSLIATNSASHPYVDKIYLSITAFYMFAMLYFCAGFPQKYKPVFKFPSQWIRPCWSNRLNQLTDSFMTLPEHSIVMVSMVQYPVHLYSAIALRISNAALLKGSSENSWGFGQIVALVTVSATLLECVRGMKKYFQKRNRSLLDDPQG